MYGCAGESVRLTLGADLDQLAGVHDHDRVGQVSGRSNVVGHVEDCESLAIAKIGKQVEHAETDRHIEHRHRFIGQQDARAHRQRSGDRDTLALATRQFVRKLVGELRGWVKRDPVQQLPHHRLSTSPSAV